MILIVDFGSSKVPDIQRTLNELGYANDVIKWNDIKEAHQPKAFILSGSPILLTKVDSAPFTEKLALICSMNTPVLGICFGHQLLGIMHGSQIYLGEPVRSVTDIKCLDNDLLFQGLANPFVMAEDHTEGITLPKDFIHLASSDKYPVEAMKHKRKPLYGVQFHPEVSRENGLTLFRNFCKTFAD